MKINMYMDACGGWVHVYRHTCMYVPVCMHSLTCWTFICFFSGDLKMDKIGNKDNNVSFVLTLNPRYRVVCNLISIGI